MSIMTSKKNKKKVAVKTKGKKKVATKRKAPSNVKSKSVQRREAVQKKKKGDYLVSIYLNDQVFEGEGDTSLEALSAVSIPNPVVKTKVILTLLHDGKKAEQVIMGVQLKRILFNHVAREIWAKRVELRLR